MKTIIILKNDDGTEKVIMQNMDGMGEETVIEKAIVRHEVAQEAIPGCFRKAQINLSINALPCKDKLYTVNTVTPNLSNHDLVCELRRRLND